MVLSHDVPLRQTERAILEFLIKVVFGPQRKLSSLTSRRECLRHDVLEASEIIKAYLEKAKKKRGFTDACHLVYGNTIVLAQQVSRLLCDATRIREVLSYTYYLAEEEERRRRTREQMEIDETPTKKKKRRSNAVDDDGFILQSPFTANTATPQQITMPDVYAMRMDTNILVDDDLLPPTSEDFGILYGFMGSEATTAMDTTFLDRFTNSGPSRNLANEVANFYDPSPVAAPPVPPVQFDDDFDYPRPTYGEILSPPMVEMARQEEMEQEEVFNASPHLAHLLMYGKMPLLDEGMQRRSMEDEMDDAREQAINVEPFSQPAPDAFPRISATSTHFSMDDISPSDILRQVGTPARPPRTPRTPRVNVYNYTGNDSMLDAQTRFRIPLTAMHRMMENFSSLHYENGRALLVKTTPKITVKDLMKPLPYSLQKGCNNDLLDVFNVNVRGCDPNTGNSGVSDDDEEDEIDSEVTRRRQPKIGELEELDLENLAFYRANLNSPMLSPLRPIEDVEQVENPPFPPPEPQDHQRPEPPPMDLDFDLPVQQDPSNPNESERIEEPRREEPRRSAIPGMERMETREVLREDPNYHFGARDMDRSAADDKTCEMLRNQILSECEDESPYPIQLDTIVKHGTTRREAARAFYAVLELLKEQRVKVVQISEYGQIDIRLSGVGSEDIEMLAMEQEEQEQDDDVYA